MGISHSAFMMVLEGCKPDSVFALRRRESFVFAAVPGIRPLSQDRSGPLQDSLFGLAPDGVFRAASLALRAVRSYRTFSPSPPVRAGGCLFSVALSVGTFIPPACISIEQT